MKARNFVWVSVVALVVFGAMVYMNMTINGIDKEYARMIKQREDRIKEMEMVLDSLGRANTELVYRYDMLTDSVAMYIERVRERDKKIEDIKNESAINYIRINDAGIGTIFGIFAGIDTSRIRH